MIVYLNPLACVCLYVCSNSRLKYHTPTVLWHQVTYFNSGKMTPWLAYCIMHFPSSQSHTKALLFIFCTQTTCPYINRKFRFCLHTQLTDLIHIWNGTKSKHGFLRLSYSVQLPAHALLTTQFYWRMKLSQNSPYLLQQHKTNLS